MKGIIYEYYNHVQDMYYIGQTIVRFAKRDWEHRNSKNKCRSWFDNCYAKHPEQFSSKILVTVKCPTKKLLHETLDDLEIAFIAYYKSIERKLYNILDGGNKGWANKKPTEGMLNALAVSREKWNKIQKSQKKNKEEALLAHRHSSKKYRESHPEKFKRQYTEQNRKRAEYKKEWYLKHRQEILTKLRKKTSI